MLEFNIYIFRLSLSLFENFFYFLPFATNIWCEWQFGGGNLKM
jgi:hypothetical protein